MRLFVAIPLPSVAQALVRGFGERSAELFPGYRWTRSDLVHITMKFIGEVDDVTAAAASQAVGSITLGPPFSLRFGEVVLLGPPRDKRVVAMKLTGDVDRLEDIFVRLEDAFARLGFARETRTFLPHVTVARLNREGRALEHLPRTTPPKPWFTVTSLQLFQSTLGGPEPIYDPLVTIPMIDPTTL